MPIQKFRSVGAIQSVERFSPGTKEHNRALRAVFWMAAKLSPNQQYPPGVYKYRSLEEAQAQKRSWRKG
jgi:hypothetical protein